MEQEDCIIEMVSTPNQKKLKQARLPFQTLSSSESSGTVPSKKRKHTSSSPINWKSEKIARKENVLKRNDDTDVNNKSEKDEEIQVIDDVILDVDKKTDGRISVKPNALTRFLQKGSVSTAIIKPQEPNKTSPMVILTRCDNKDESNESKSDNSSNEKSIDDSLESNKGEDMNCEKSTGECGDTSVMSSDVESEISSSEDDDNDDDKKSNDDMEGTEQKNDNNTEKTLTPSKSTQKSEMKKRKLTPRQLEKKIQSMKKQEERQKMKAERVKQRMEEKMKRRQEKEAEKEHKRKEKEHKELKKQIEIEQKQKEKERKEEDRRKREEAKEEEKRKKEEERLELERKKQKAASTFVSFFVPKKQETKSAVEERIIGAYNFMPFEIKADMKVAPTCRRTLSNAEKLLLDTVCFNNTVPPSKLYLDEIKNDRSKTRRSEKTWPAEAKDDVVVVEEDDNSTNIIDQTNVVIEKHRPKLLFFAENRRPPYWGTWRKKSNKVDSRRPFNKDKKWFDYEIDSDEEWEEEEPGESLRGSDDEKDEENPDDDEYDVDNEFMVPHGYLSDEEARADGEDGDNVSPEIQKVKLKILGEQFEAEMNEKTAKIKPKVIGCIWQGPLNSYPENTSSNVVKFLTARQAWVAETPITLANTVEVDILSNTDVSMLISKKQSTPGKKKTTVPKEALPELIRLVHGNPHGRLFLIKEFITYWHRKYPEDKQQLSKISVAQKIQELATRIACPEEGPMHMKICWYIPEETRKKYLNEDLILPNKWSYVLTPKRKTLNEATDLLEKIEKEKEFDRDEDKEQKNKEREKKNVPLITQFAKKITQEEMKKQLSVKSSPKPSSIMMPNKPPKRAALISVARGESFPTTPIVNAFSKVSQSLKDNEVNQPTTSKIPIIIDNSSNSLHKQDVLKDLHYTKDNENI